MLRTYDALFFAGSCVFFTFFAGFAIIGWVLHLSTKELKKEGGPRKPIAWIHGFLAIFQHPLKLIALLLLMIFPGVLFFGFLERCVLDQPFEPALVHAVGQTLGLGDVSSPGAMHLALPNVNASTFCTGGVDRDRVLPLVEPDSSFDPWFSAEKGTCSPSTWWACDHRHASAMLSVHPIHTLISITQDDLDALNVLYPPQCGSARISDPLHVPSASWYAGWTLVGSFALPLTILSMIIPPCALFSAVLRKGFSPVPAEKIQRLEARSATRIRERSIRRAASMTVPSATVDSACGSSSA
jgi:hypothetical protein